MTNREPSPVYTVVDFDEYEENMDDRVPVEEILGSDEVYVFYGRVRNMARVAIRSYTSVSIETFETNGIRASGSITFRDIDFSPPASGYEFSGIFHARFFIPDSTNPILVRPGKVLKMPIEMGYFVREDEGYDDELAAEMAQPSLDRESELVST